jgi:hypothetical protein
VPARESRTCSIALETGADDESLTFPTSVPDLSCAIDRDALTVDVSAITPTNILNTDRETAASTDGICPPEFVYALRENIVSPDHRKATGSV